MTIAHLVLAACWIFGGGLRIGAAKQRAHVVIGLLWVAFGVLQIAATLRSAGCP